MQSTSGKTIASWLMWPLMAVMLHAAAPRASAQEPLLGEIKWVAFNFAPRGWARCDGQLLPIAQNTALFSLLGTTYGGNGQTTFALPDARGRSLVHDGQGPGLAPIQQGEVGGAEAHTLTLAELPSHNHGVASHTHDILPLDVDLRASSAAATTATPGGNVLAAAVGGTGDDDKGHKKSNRGKKKGHSDDDDVQVSIYNAGPADVSLASGSAMTKAGTTGGGSGATMSTGGGAPFSIRPPFLGMQCIIALEGIFPSRP